jgi:AcrR family transcriptional regulator
LNRALVYGYFKSKDDLLEALVRREMHKYGELWFEHLMADPQGCTVASIYRSVAYALKNTPFMAAIVMRDQGTFGKYLRKPGNIFEGMQWMRSQTAWSAFPGQARLRHSMSCSKPSLKCSIGC